MIFNIFLKFKVKLLLSGKLKLKIFFYAISQLFLGLIEQKIRLYFEIYIFQTFKSSKRVYFLSLIKQKKSDFHFHIPFLRDSPPLHFSIFLNTNQIAELYIDARDA